jgi:shikimate dehydrogenase
MHNAAFSACGLNAVYLAFETKDLDGCVKGLQALGIKGMSVTIPHKSAIIRYLNEIDDPAKRIGAVNTIVNDNGHLVGYNTDAIAARKALAEKVQLSGKTCLLVGAGGAARAIGFALREKGVALKVVNRTPERGRMLARFLSCPFIHLDELEETTADILIQTTSVGMAPHHDKCLIPEHILRQEMAVMDIIYNPLETKLLKMARARGCLTINGLDMFIRQGAEQFRLWTGIDPPVDNMLQAVKQVLTQNR